ncbi:MAG: hypothetical protein CMJ49_06895, partial [Planctomycetaceae bacterium]|nr:hypothetical protein [Planctomycetaceae bacterium]
MLMPMRGGRGAVLVITLLGMVLLAALVMFVVNVGQQVNRRVTVQHSADAAAHAAAGWIARGMNTVAMNNVAISQQIALVNVLDAAEDATRFTAGEMESLAEALEEQLGMGVPAISDGRGGGPAVRDVVEDLWEAMLVEMADQRDLLMGTAAAFDETDVREVTFYETPSGDHGRFWRSMSAMRSVSKVTMRQVGEMAQLAAVHAGRDNLGHELGEVVLAPMRPSVPFWVGGFDDFERPVKQGLLPEGVDDERDRRGPYDAAFGWRHLVREGGQFIPDFVQASNGGSGTVPIGSGAPVTGRWIPGEVTGYVTYGPQRWLLDQVWSFNRSTLRHSRYAARLARMASMKLRYLWPGDDDALSDVVLGSVVEPEWVTGYD